MVFGSNQEVRLTISKGPRTSSPVVLTKVEVLFNILLDYADMLKLLQINVLKNLVYICQYFRLLEKCPVHNTKQNINCNMLSF